jgi:ketosteroid isomerase-like protein
MRMTRGPLLMAALGVALCACQQAPADQSAAAVDEIRAADIAWEKVFTGGDTSAAVAAVEPDGSMLAPNAPIATGHDAVRAAIAGFYALPDMTLHWQPTKVEAASSGDFGYSMGTYELSFTDPNGQAVTDHRKYVTIWRKQADGTWKVVADIFNSDLPAPVM